MKERRNYNTLNTLGKLTKYYNYSSTAILLSLLQPYTDIVEELKIVTAGCVTPGSKIISNNLVDKIIEKLGEI